MIDIHGLLERQAQWQKSRQALSWPEKIRMAQSIRDSVEAMRSRWVPGLRNSVLAHGVVQPPGEKPNSEDLAPT